MSAGEAPIVTRAAPLFDVRAVSKWFPVRSGALNRVTGRLKAVDRVTLRIDAGTIVGLVGESGSGKTTVGRLLVKLLEPSSGTIAFQGRDLGALTRRDLRWLRKNVQMLFQDPFLSLNPHKTILQTVAYPLRLHGLATRAELGPRVGDLLRRVGLDPALRLCYPHELSGGERQRVSLAAALSVEPRFIFCDEPVSALDVSARAQVLNLLREIQAEQRLTLLIVSHDLSAVEYLCDDVAIMYLGNVVEVAPREPLFREPAHPYTRALMSAIPEPDSDSGPREQIVLHGEIPSPMNPPAGCKFHTRCQSKIGAVCEAQEPARSAIASGHEVACHLFSTNGRRP
jgi:oligopeptide/dipeptide ABC transporter ATP-binding protein